MFFVFVLVLEDFISFSLVFVGCFFICSKGSIVGYWEKCCCFWDGLLHGYSSFIFEFRFVLSIRICHCVFLHTASPFLFYKCSIFIWFLFFWMYYCGLENCFLSNCTIPLWHHIHVGNLMYIFSYSGKNRIFQSCCLSLFELILLWIRCRVFFTWIIDRKYQTRFAFPRYAVCFLLEARIISCVEIT